MEAVVVLFLLAVLAALVAWLLDGVGRGVPGVLRRSPPSCSACRYYDRGACRRFPPGRVYTGDTAKDPAALDVTVWPVVQDSNWCGEFRGKP